MTNSTFEQGERLRQIIESHGWTLYEVDETASNDPNELEARGPAESYKIGKEYICWPIPRSGESLDATIVKAIEGVKVPALDLYNTVVSFIRINFDTDRAHVLSPPPLPARAEIPYENGNLIRAFEQGFFISSPVRTRKLEQNLN